MKSHKPSKLIALGLALTMGLSIPAALAASSLVPASTKVTVTVRRPLSRDTILTTATTITSYAISPAHWTWA